MENNNKFTSLVVILIIVVGFMGILTLVSNQKLANIKDDITKLEAKQKERNQYNDKIKEQQKEEDARVGNDRVTTNAKYFNDKFYNWSSWNEFSDNMENLKKRYPNLEDSDIVDISGKSVGNGESPESTYSSDIYPTDKKGQIAELITQTKSEDETDTELVWFKVEDYDNGKYNISYLKPYQKANLSDEE
ncbi:hypothetical protein [Staphylococcus saprophyticus]|uniref:hypothetical protein n=1 Tax=Staphylococcus saprophyticus TaxID=29385 RepID=UPI0034C626B3